MNSETQLCQALVHYQNGKNTYTCRGRLDGGRCLFQENGMNNTTSASRAVKGMEKAQAVIASAGFREDCDILNIKP